MGLYHSVSGHLLFNAVATNVRLRMFERWKLGRNLLSGINYSKAPSCVLHTVNVHFTWSVLKIFLRADKVRSFG